MVRGKSSSDIPDKLTGHPRTPGCQPCCSRKKSTQESGIEGSASAVPWNFPPESTTEKAQHCTRWQGRHGGGAKLKDHKAGQGKKDSSGEAVR